MPHPQTNRRRWFKIRRRDRDLRLWRRAPVNSPPGCSVCAELICQQAIRAQTVCSRKRLHPQIPVKIDTTEKGADKSQLPFPWRRDRDLNPGRHHCLTRFRIVRVQPLRHLCKGGGHTDAEAVRPEYIQTDASSILQEIGKKSNRFCALAGDFLVERKIISVE